MRNVKGNHARGSIVQAAVLSSCPGELTIEEVETGPIGPRDVLIRTAYAGLCHSDYHFMTGDWQTPTPSVMGHESAGVIEAVGSDVTDLVPGDHVITCTSAFCGHCQFCLIGKPFLCQGARRTDRLRLPGGGTVHQFAGLGSFGEQILIHEHGCVKISKDMPLDLASLIGCAVITGVGAAWNSAKVRPGDTVAVFGCGGIGLNVIQGAYLAGAARIFAIDLVDSKLELAKSFGATDTLRGDQDAVAAVLEATKGGVQHAFEAIGLKTTAEQAFRTLRSDGTAYVIGMVPLNQKLELGAQSFMSERKIQGALMGSNRFRIDMPIIVDLYLQGRLQLDQLLSGTLPLDEINEGFAGLASGEIARQVIDFG